MTDVVLPDGRSLEVIVTGPAEGVPLVFHHGTPGSAMQFTAIQRAVTDRGLQAGHVVPSRVRRDRPDCPADASRTSQRTPRPCSTTSMPIVAWWPPGPAADRTPLPVVPCSRTGWSECCRSRVSRRSHADGLDWSAGMGDENVEEFGAAAGGEAALRPYLDAVRGEMVQITGEDLSRSMATLLPPVDLAALTGEFADDLAASFRAAVANGIDGWLDDDLAFLQPWGFEPADVTVPTLLWQGVEDLMVPVSHGRWLAANLPKVTAAPRARRGPPVGHARGDRPDAGRARGAPALTDEPPAADVRGSS